MKKSDKIFKEYVRPELIPADQTRTICPGVPFRIVPEFIFHALVEAADAKPVISQTSVDFAQQELAAALISEAIVDEINNAVVDAQEVNARSTAEARSRLKYARSEHAKVKRDEDHE